MFCFRLIFVTSKYGRNRALVQGRRAGPDVSCMQYVQVQGGMEMLRGARVHLECVVSGILGIWVVPE